VRRSLETDVILTGSPAEHALWTGRFRAERGTAGGDVLETALVGDADTVAARIVEYAAAGATDLMLGFADFPATGMLERFARDVAPRLAGRTCVRTGRVKPGARGRAAAGRTLRRGPGRGR
jgi:alkanesulfonate monooxygenase SsuD/methylene tetrahydromethanopterin reductase-like flavin-dependent oxidoreductase (luciferase family)